ncbi:conserved hypothetical protein [Methanocaldococcus infernus ME]|uniref:Uncharacterized protein n=1 Tax=Methanocaldococcus infernus (strain DSM 11812 / JCM 15783 / ME) TaxID=573063 RepID=D5VSE1_METIM|nr:hypothetical protein [Methanocaldococcus infernus]ADG13494.1 conserved hypothetical protein [Methanocaldococcus infernus ME]
MPYWGHGFIYNSNWLPFNIIIILLILLLIIILALQLYIIFKKPEEAKLVKIEKDVEEVKEIVKELKRKWEEI